MKRTTFIVTFCVLLILLTTACMTVTAPTQQSATQVSSTQAPPLISSTTTSSPVATDTSSPDSCSFSGTWGDTHPAGPSVISVQFQADAGTLAFDRTGGGFPPAHIDGTFTYDTATSHLVMTNTAAQTSDPAFAACIGVAGTYTTNFPDCTHVVLTLVSDTCDVRVRWANGATLTKH